MSNEAIDSEPLAIISLDLVTTKRSDMLPSLVAASSTDRQILCFIILYSFKEIKDPRLADCPSCKV